MKEKISIVVPCYNEQNTLPKLVKEVKKLRESLKDCTIELILVNDGSSDQTLSVMKELSAVDHDISYLSFSRNFGKEAAMYAGLCNAQGDYIAVMDADLQDPPELLIPMYEALKTGEYDCAAARRTNRKGEPPIRSWFAKRFYRLLTKISDMELLDGVRDYRLMKRSMVDVIVNMHEYNRFSKGIFEWVGFRKCWIEYENTPRSSGGSKWNFWGLTKYAIDGIVNFSEVPLSIASWLGLFMTSISFLAVIFIVIRKLLIGDPVDGWASTASIIVFIGGLQLFCLGIIGKYLAKVYLETKKRPHFIVSETNMGEIKNVG